MIALFDLDGTLSLAEHRLHHIRGKRKNYKAFFAASKHDEPFEAILDLARRLYKTGVEIVIFSGRSDEVREDTEAWLDEHLGVPYRLMMRPERDFTPDNILKRSWLDNPELIDRSRVMWVFDDRSRVVEMWRQAGLTCLQVAPGDF